MTRFRKSIDHLHSKKSANVFVIGEVMLLAFVPFFNLAPAIGGPVWVAALFDHSVVLGVLSSRQVLESSPATWNE